MSIWGRKIFRKILRSRYYEQPKMAYDDFGDYGWKNTSEPSSSTQHIKLYMFLCWNSLGPITVRIKYDQKQIIMEYKASIKTRYAYVSFIIKCISKCVWSLHLAGVSVKQHRFYDFFHMYLVTSAKKTSNCANMLRWKKMILHDSTGCVDSNIQSVFSSYN